MLLRHPVAAALRAAAAGVPGHLVGGVVRDRLLGLPAADFDASVERDGLAIAERLAAALPARLVVLGGKSFAAYRLVAHRFVVDLWDREGSTLYHDLARRDFTVNALALDLDSGELADPFDGQRDLADRVLRAVTTASFTGDPLRVLRLARLAVQLPGFAADPAALALARASSPALARIAAERVREELRLLFELPDAHHGLALLGELDLYPGLWLGRPGESAAADIAGAIHEMECWARAALVFRRLALGWADELDAPAARLAITFAHLAGAPEAAAAALGRITAAGYLVRERAQRVAQLLAAVEVPSGEPATRRFLHEAGELWPTAVCLLGARAARDREAASWNRWERWLRAIVELLESAQAEILQPPVLLDGDEIQELLGLPAGPAIGRARQRIRSAQVAGEVRTAAEARALLLAGEV